MTSAEVISPAEGYPITPKSHGVDFLMKHRHLHFRSQRQWCIGKVRHTVVDAIRRFFNDNGFTLIEVLLVVAILGILAGVVVVNFSGKQKKAQINAARASNALTLEAWVTPANTTQSGPARIVTLSATPQTRNFTLGQDGPAYNVRLRTTATDDNGNPSLSSAPGTLTTV